MWRVREWLAVFDVRRWVYSWRRARHVVAVTEYEANQDFYGSMNLGDERSLYWPAPVHLEYHHEEWPGWREQTAADLSPEALERLCGLEQPQERPAPGDSRDGTRSPGNENRDRGTDSGPGVELPSGSVAPGPDWLDRQLAAHVAWVARMAPLVTGWSVAA